MLFLFARFLVACRSDALLFSDIRYLLRVVMLCVCDVLFPSLLFCVYALCFYSLSVILFCVYAC